MTAGLRASVYQSYLLRLWREEQNHEIVWRSSLESAQTGEQFNFATLAHLIDFLWEQTSKPDESRQNP